MGALLGKLPGRLGPGMQTLGKQHIEIHRKLQGITVNQIQSMKDLVQETLVCSACVSLASFWNILDPFGSIWIVGKRRVRPALTGNGQACYVPRSARCAISIG